jgi:single-strand DNA-binding protein
MILTGLARLGRDADLRYTPQGETVCNLALAFNYGKRSDDGKRDAQWVDAALWGKRAEALSRYLTKGTAVDVILADPHIETYQGKNGPGQKLVARVVDIELAGSRPAGSAPAPGRPAQSSAPPAAGGGEFSDDIPF